MKNSLKFCLVGRGSIGTRHLKNLKSLSCNRVIAFSKVPEKKKDAEYKAKYGIDTVYAIKDLRKFGPDAFVIANPTSKHMKFAKLALDLNSHIFMEKPLSHGLAGVCKLQNELEERELTFCLANNFRFHPALMCIKNMIEKDAFGKIYFARIMVGQYLPDWHPGEDYKESYSAKKLLGGGVVLTLQHEIDYAYWLFGRFKRIKSFVKKVSELQIDVEDIASIIIDTETGHLVEIHLDYLQRPAKRGIQIQGSKGSIDYTFGDSCLRFFDFKTKKSKVIIRLDGYDNNLMYIDEMRNFIRSISGKEKPRSTIEDAIYILQACLKIKEGTIT